MRRGWAPLGPWGSSPRGDLRGTEVALGVPVPKLLQPLGLVARLQSAPRIALSILVSGLAFGCVGDPSGAESPDRLDLPGRVELGSSPPSAHDSNSRFDEEMSSTGGTRIFEGGLTLPMALERAARANPTLKAAEESRYAAEERRAQATAWPDPRVTLGVFAQPIETRIGEQRWTLGFQQAFPWPDTLEVRGDRADLEASLADVEVQMRARDLVVDVVTAYWELAYLRSALAIQGETFSLATGLSARTYGRPNGDPASVPDQARTEVWIAELDYDGQLLRELIEVEEERLRALLDLPGATPIGDLHLSALPTFEGNLEQILDRAHGHSLELRLAELRVAEGALRSEEAGLAKRPNLTLGAKYIGVEPYNFASPSGNGNDALAFELGFSLPALNGRAAAAERESRHTAVQRRFERDAARNALRAALARALFGVRNSDRLRRLYRDSLAPRSERTALATLGLFEVGEANFGAVLEAYSGWHHERLAALRAEVDHAQALARLEGLVGAPLALVPNTTPDPGEER